MIYDIKTPDFYKDLENNPILLNRLDTSNLPVNHPCYCVDRKKVPGTFTDETSGEAIWEMVALRAKSYGYNLAGTEKIKAKGVRGHVVKNHMTIEDHKQCLFRDASILNIENAKALAVKQSMDFESTSNPLTSKEYTPFRVNKSFRSFKHQMKTVSTIKLALNRHDDKRYVLDDQIHTLAHGHNSIM